MDVVVLYVEDFDVFQLLNYYSLGGDMIGNFIVSLIFIIWRFVLEFVVILIFKDRERFLDDNLN